MHTSRVETHTSTIPHIPCRAGQSTSAAAWAMAEVPSPASLVNTPGPPRTAERQPGCIPFRPLLRPPVGAPSRRSVPSPPGSGRPGQPAPPPRPPDRAAPSPGPDRCSPGRCVRSPHHHQPRQGPRRPPPTASRSHPKVAWRAAAMELDWTMSPRSGVAGRHARANQPASSGLFRPSRM